MENTSKCLAEYNSIMKETDEIYRSIAKRFSLPDCTFWILYTLRADSATQTQSEICRAMYQPKQTVNTALKKLEADGCITLGCTADRRSKQISLTQKGVELAEKTVDRVIEIEKKTLSQFSDDEQKSLIALLQKYAALLKGNIDNL